MIRAHDGSHVLTLDVEGPATMTESPAVNEVAVERLSRGVRALRIDLRDCTTMDSTFSGTLLALERRLANVGGTLTLVSPSDRVVELLNQMGLEDFYAIDRSNRDDGPWTTLPTPCARRQTLQQLVLDAHDELARLPGTAGRTFRAVVDELRRPVIEEPSDGSDPVLTAGAENGSTAHLD